MLEVLLQTSRRTIVMGNFGAGEIILIFMVVLLLFGAKRIPEIASSMGKGIREFKSATRDIQNEIESAAEEPPKNTPPS
jgi:sec-independent protein translocase protein TatA